VSDIFSSFDETTPSFPQVGDLPAVATTDFSLPPDFFSNLFGGGSPFVTPVQNLPSTGSTGMTGFLNDAANLAASIYKGQAQVAAAKSYGQLAQVGAARQAAAASLTPWLFVAIAAAGFLALRSSDGGPPIHSVVTTTRRGG
jgi:hypothetical protein